MWDLSTTKFVAIVVAISAALLSLAVWGEVATCHGKWRDSGMDSRFGFPEGCMVRLRDGRWIPQAAYRETP